MIPAQIVCLKAERSVKQEVLLCLMLSAAEIAQKKKLPDSEAFRDTANSEEKGMH